MNIAVFFSNRFNIWRRAPYKRAIVRSYSEGVINSFQMHELCARLDAPEQERKKPEGGYPQPISVARMIWP